MSAADAILQVESLSVSFGGVKVFSFRTSDIELRRRGPSYTIDTVRAFAARWGGRPTLLLGADALLDLHAWREAAALLREARVVVYARPGSEAAARRARDLHVTYHRDLLSPVASRDVRRLARAGESLRYLVPEPVRRYIEAHGLYGWRPRSRS